MTSAEVALVQTSFRRLLPVMDQVGTLFFARLLQVDPELRRQFDCDAVPRDRRLVQWVALAVNGLSHPATLSPVVRRAGRRSADLFLGYGRMETIWTVLMRALEEVAGRPFGPETRNAWMQAYWFLANLLRDGAHEAGIAA
jgi:hemoglobin-like flavoprotein